MSHRRGMIYVLTFPEFETSVAEKIARFRSEHEPQRAKLVPPHVTLVFGLKNVDTSEILLLCENTAKRVPEFAVEFATSDVSHDPFENTYKRHLCASTGSQILTDLHQQLYDGPHRNQLHPDHPFRPHMTIATHSDASIVQRAYPTDIGPFPITGTIRSLEIMDLTGPQIRKLRTVPLA